MFGPITTVVENVHMDATLYFYIAQLMNDNHTAGLHTLKSHSFTGRNSFNHYNQSMPVPYVTVINVRNIGFRAIET
jgi:hypothetical protein